ncbi:Rpp14/Pop5 family-domain-containing protein [Pestalotiopsis sp. NC0098]|nr:Rpp14/Pop5 family-domain-containing protein [Pestalotiopsis sp. NC0098]
MVRIKERYLLVNILYPTELSAQKTTTTTTTPDLIALNQPTTDKFDRNALLRELRAQVASLFGDYGSGAAASLQVKYLSPATSTFILRVNRAHYRLVWAALTMMDHVPVRDGKLCTYRVVHVSGTIRKVEEEAIRRARDMMLAVKDQAGAKGNSALAAIMSEGKRTRQTPPTKSAEDLEYDSEFEDQEMADFSDS